MNQSNLKEMEKDDLIKKMDELPDLVRLMGGRVIAKKKLKLFKALIMYKTPEAGLKAFRKETAAKGYGGLTKELIAIAKEYGTVKDKMTLCLLAYFDRERDGEKTLISKAEFERIRDKMYAFGHGDEMAVYLHTYTALRKIEDQVNLTKFGYKITGEKAAQYLVTFLWLKRTEQLFNTLKENSELFDELVCEYEAKTGTFPKDLLDLYKPIAPLLEQYEKDLMETSEWGGALDDDGTDFHRIKDKDINSVWDYFLACCDMARYRLSEFKGAIAGVKAWVKDTKAEMLMTTRLKTIIDFAPFDTTIDAIPDRFCENYIKKMEEEGAPINDDDRDKAVFPIFDEVETNEEMRDFIYKRITEIYEGKG